MQDLKHINKVHISNYEYSEKQTMNIHTNRTNTYRHLSTELSVLSDRQLSDLLEDSDPLHSGMGGKSFLLKIDGIPVFVKKVPLTNLELLPENIQSTANLFNLPLYFQYGIGSKGFGAWRELAAHTMTTNWVLSGECPHFPLTYHWRVLQAPHPLPMSFEESENFERDVALWGNSKEIRERFEAVQNASSHLFLFLEFVPEVLSKWLDKQITIGDTGKNAVAMVTGNMKTTIDFMRANNFIHFDAHFENILTDGNQIYFADFGLSLSSKFKLSQEEVDFLNTHRTYDQCSAAVNLLHCIITSLFGKDKWELKLQDYLDGKSGEVAPYLASLIKKYGPIACIMDDFYQNLRYKTKTTPYPRLDLERLLVEIE